MNSDPVSSAATIATDRLELLPLTVDALDALIAGDANRLRRLTGAVFPTPVDAPPLMADALPFFRDRLRAQPDEGPWWARLIVQRASGTAVGSAGFSGPPAEDGIVTVGYSVYPAHQRRGYASEAVSALVVWALTQPGVTHVRATIPPTNVPSRRVAEIAGLRPTGEVSWDDEAGEVEIWQTNAGRRS